MSFNQAPVVISGMDNKSTVTVLTIPGLKTNVRKLVGVAVRKLVSLFSIARYLYAYAQQFYFNIFFFVSVVGIDILTLKILLIFFYLFSWMNLKFFLIKVR
jgi:hypothetical protein